MQKKHSIKERELAVRLCKKGLAPETVGKQLGIKPDYISEWNERYRLYGVKGLKKQPYKYYSYEEKCKIICEFREKHIPLYRVSAKYCVSQSIIQSWNRLVKAYGYAALQESKNRGRPPKNKDMGRPKKREPQTELEKLQRENEYLRAENAYLKKLRALVLEKEAQKRKNEL